jgi:hypothetical protein
MAPRNEQIVRQAYQIAEDMPGGTLAPTGNRMTSRVRVVVLVPRPASPSPERNGQPRRRARRRTRHAGDEGEGKKIAEGLFEGTLPGPTLRHNAAMALTDRHRHLRGGRTGAVVQHLRRAGRRCRHHRPLELPGHPAHPVPGSGPVRGEHRRGQDARADRARGQPGRADRRRGQLAAPRRGQHLHRIRQHWCSRRRDTVRRERLARPRGYARQYSKIRAPGEPG